MVVVGAGLLTLGATSLLGVVRFAAIPEPLAVIARIDEAQRDFLVSLVLIGAVFLALSALAAWLSARAVSADVHFVTRRVHAMAERGDLGEPVAIRTLDEVGALTRAFEELRQGYFDQIVRERTAHKQAQEADRIKSEFLTTVSHELRTPLNAIIGFSEVMGNEMLGPLGNQRYREYLDDIQDSGRHLLGVINNLLLFAKMEAGQHRTEIESLDLGEELTTVLRMLQMEAKRREVRLIAGEIDPDTLVRADAQSLRQILINVIGNAIKFSPVGGRVEIARAPAPEAGRLRISVADRGCGIPHDTLRQLGNPFVQAEGAFARRHQGTGLGLAICFGLAQAMGASLTIESEEHAGTTVILDLRLASDGAPKGAGPL